HDYALGQGSGGPSILCMRTRSQSREQHPPPPEEPPVVIEPLRIEYPFQEDPTVEPMFQEDPPVEPVVN
ncbi:hypothetical protein Tco_0538911, partial [Tanacetum coccineum]